MRYERPNDRNRWERPLFVVRPEDDRLPVCVSFFPCYHAILLLLLPNRWERPLFVVRPEDDRLPVRVFLFFSVTLTIILLPLLLLSLVVDTAYAVE